MKRRFPSVSELRPLMQFELPTLDRRAARLARAADVWDLRAIAKRRTPRPAFDYVDGAAQRELTVRRTREAFDAVELLPRILHGTEKVDLSTMIAGGSSSLPFGIAPTGFTRFMHAEGEDGGAAAAAAAGIPFSLSTMGTRSIEQVAVVSGGVADGARRWFQLYLWKDRQKSLDLLERAAASGYDTLLVTVDTPVAGQRLRDVRNGMVIPPKLTLKTVLDASYRPEWWFNFLTTDPLTFASLTNTSQDLPTLINSMFDPTLSIADLEWIRSVWGGKLFVKGILTAEDTRRALDAGADGLIVSNHGGRQLDRAPVSLQALPEVRAEAGDEVEIILDSGIMSGADVVAALCSGADFTLIGRAYLYGLMAGGREGVARVIELLAKEIEVTMQLIGAATVADLGPHLLRSRQA
ncbi:L-lactate dehydrogenase [Sinomonas cellulolyticus]|uniref:Alpha-hydroxy-acid oxidizing protein n=1 Tax=Sinomonas cellulolyticus TaxID=2801916 RepID=A0ABS1K435_9MICC|nr:MULTISPECIES: alpha-hydroxy acid oxidase [Sinomonas]MBL0706042.1 alpha-hydroxy-acid oxidizing protein [Sinomonas cellulolyticus]GHG43188.1 L-lactate dehydrogenase [Sinomonas sp. KCTC 49339]